MNAPEWYVEEVAKLRAIMQQGLDGNEPTVHRDYVNEKLDRILTGVGISIHPTLKDMVDNILGKTQ